MDLSLTYLTAVLVNGNGGPDIHVSTVLSAVISCFITRSRTSQISPVLNTPFKIDQSKVQVVYYIASTDYL